MAKKKAVPTQQQSQQQPAATGWQNMPWTGAPPPKPSPGMSPADLIARSQARQNPGYDPDQATNTMLGNMSDQQLMQMVQGAGIKTGKSSASDVANYVRQNQGGPGSILNSGTLMGATTGQGNMPNTTNVQGGIPLGAMAAMMQASGGGQGGGQQSSLPPGFNPPAGGNLLGYTPTAPQGGPTPQGPGIDPTTGGLAGSTPPSGFKAAPPPPGAPPPGAPNSYLTS